MAVSKCLISGSVGRRVLRMVIVMFPCYGARLWFKPHLVVETERYFMLILRWTRLGLLDTSSLSFIVNTVILKNGLVT